jgi:hypothetical protein
VDNTDIAGPPLRLDLAFVWAWEGPPPTGKPLAGPAGALLRSEVEARLDRTGRPRWTRYSARRWTGSSTTSGQTCGLSYLKTPYIR